MPIRLVIGRIQKLFVRVPWNALSSKPVQLEIQGLQLLVEPLDNSEWANFVQEQNKFENVEKKLIEYTIQVFQEMAKAKQDPDSQSAQEQQGFIMNLTSKILDNI